jgi:hypothetical protein
MEVTYRLLTRLISAGLIMALLAPPAAMARESVAGNEKQNQNTGPAVAQQSQPAQATSPVPDSSTTPAAAEPQPAQDSRDQLPDSPDPAQSQANTQTEPPATAESNPEPAPQAKTNKPVGTAAAEVQNTTGDAAFKPAGAVIAPAKQRRTRMILLKVGVLVGAGVAIGSVAALSSASPSRPPGSH